MRGDSVDETSRGIELPYEAVSLPRDIVVTTFERVGHEDRVANCLDAERTIVGRHTGIREAAGGIELGERAVDRGDGTFAEIRRVERIAQDRQTLVVRL